MIGDLEIHSGGRLSKGERLLAERRLPGALEAFREAETAGEDPDRCASGRWTVHMLSGEFELAWQESDAIRERGAPDPHRFWRGEPLQGKRIILRCLHGFGDAVQFLRYVPLLRDCAAQLILEVPPRFQNLAHHFEGVDEVITWGEQAPQRPPKWDVQMEIMELPYIFRTQLRDLPLATNYLGLPKRLAPRDTSAPHNRLRVGIACTAGSWNSSRSFPVAMLHSLLSLEGIEFWNLNGGSDHTHRTAHPTMREDMHCRDTLDGLAATIARMDLVITVDTLAVHLAGAMNIPAWLMLQHEADWRWMHARDDSPWYPSLRLFRQPQPRDWPVVITRVREHLLAVSQMRLAVRR